MHTWFPMTTILLMTLLLVLVFHLMLSVDSLFLWTWVIPSPHATYRWSITKSIYRHKLCTSPLCPCLCHPQSQWPLQVSGLPKNGCAQNPVDWDQVLLWFHGKMQLECLLDQKWSLLFQGSVLSLDNINMMRYMQHSIRAHQIILQLITFTEGKWVHLPLTCHHLCYVIVTNQ